ncbi:MAG: ribonuclease HI family protein [Candidatus Neomarinimicrobiota bacterium]
MFSLYFDGASRSNPGPASYGGVIYEDNVERYTYKKYIGSTTNNVAEYQALLNGLLCAQEKGITNVNVYGDSKLVIEQVTGNWKVNSPLLKPIHREICALLATNTFDTITFQHVYRKNNKRADELANEALDEQLGLGIRA